MNEVHFFEQFRFLEPVDIGLLDEIISNESDIELRVLLRSLREPVSVRYKLGEDGRVYPRQGLSFGEIKNPIIKRKLLGTDWSSIEIVNCHANILNQSISPRRSIVSYCTDRNHILEEVSKMYEVSTADAKMLFIHLMQMRPFATWASMFAKRNVHEKTRFIEQFIDDIREIRNMLHNITSFCNEIERTILRHLFDFCVREKVIPFEVDTAICILHHDGIHVLKRNRPNDMNLFLQHLGEYIFMKTGLSFEYVYKIDL